MQTYRIVTPPDDEPVTSDEVKRLLRVSPSETYDDADIAKWIRAGRQWLERKIGYVLVTETIELVADIGSDILIEPISGIIGFGSALKFELRPSPVKTITTVEIETQLNSWRVLTENTEWIATIAQTPSYVYLADFTLGYWVGSAGVTVFPGARLPRLRVTYTAGESNVNDVDGELSTAVAQAAAHLYDDRSTPIPDSIIPSGFIPWRL